MGIKLWGKENGGNCEFHFLFPLRFPQVKIMKLLEIKGIF